MKSVRITPEDNSQDGQLITSLLAIGAERQLCQLQTTFRTPDQASSYLHKHRKELERAARERFARGELEDGVVKLTMLLE
ncbi:hypothetical protein QA640_35975 [Bradyrhizobium sp. CB82]|uniref:hypothetical protein n=1 Tax=Bradyrhizobium sp. CB82 TaxID=3039159 RepID=UPI0024B1D7A5|nr:hypothetical protein [Bradyrhizobium sp. CB82]WFU39700.1 hypothetical protein QA640_35975 [Bradyrhizobium sp. CB82]